MVEVVTVAEVDEGVEAMEVEDMAAEDIDQALVEMTRNRRVFIIDKCAWLNISIAIQI